MFSRSALRRFIAWLAAWAVLCAGLLPLVSHAVVPHLTTGVGMVEVCTVTGMSWVKLDQTGATESTPWSEDPGSAMTMGSCDWCASHVVYLGVSSAPPGDVLALALPGAVPAAWLHAPRLLFAWVAAQPRAPPISA